MSVPSSCSPSSLCCSQMGVPSPLRTIALAVPSARKSLPWMSVQLSPPHSSVSIPISLVNLHPHPTTLTYFYYLHRTNTVHLFTCLSQSLQSLVSKTEFSTSKCSVSVYGMGEKRNHTCLHWNWAGRRVSQSLGRRWEGHCC